jgi:hypothetical protein
MFLKYHADTILSELFRRSRQLSSQKRRPEMAMTQQCTSSTLGPPGLRGKLSCSRRCFSNPTCVIALEIFCSVVRFNQCNQRNRASSGTVLRLLRLQHCSTDDLRRDSEPVPLHASRHVIGHDACDGFSVGRTVLRRAQGTADAPLETQPLAVCAAAGRHLSAYGVRTTSCYCISLDFRVIPQSF